MTETTENQAPMQIAVHAQYIKDFSFENPNAPQIFAPSQVQPTLDLGVNVQSRNLGDGTYESVLMIKLGAKLESKTAFIAELAYAGVFGLPNMPEEQTKLFLIIEAPRLLFPFARAILADAVRESGFPPVMLNPIDFGALYQQQLDRPAAANA